MRGMAWTPGRRGWALPAIVAGLLLGLAAPVVWLYPEAAPAAFALLSTVLIAFGARNAVHNRRTARTIAAQRTENERLLALVDAVDADRRVREQTLLAANKELQRGLDRMESCIGSIAHDLRGPLVTIDGYVQLLRHLDLLTEPPPEFDEFLLGIADGVDAMQSLVDGYLSFATANDAPLALTHVELARLVDAVAAQHIRQARVTGQPIPVITIAPLPPASADQRMLRQVIDNLISNAIKYTEPGRAAAVDVTGDRDGAGRVRIEVADRGIGIPQGERDAIFASFHRAHRSDGYAGLGLGLAICQRIVHRHGGEIGCLPNPGGGTRFWLTVPEAPGGLGAPARDARADRRPAVSEMPAARS